MYVVAQHRIRDPETARAVVRAALAELPAGLRLHHSLPNADGTAAVCLWEADSVDAVRDLVETALGHVSRNEYYAVGEEAVGLPARPFTIAQILDPGAPAAPPADARPVAVDLTGVQIEPPPQEPQVVVSFRLVARPERREELLRFVQDEMLAATRAEPGCLSYRFYQDVEDPNAFTFVEEWASADALDGHFRSAHVGRALTGIPDLVSEPPQARFHGVARTRGLEAVEAARAGSPA